MKFCPKCNFMLDITNNVSSNLLKEIKSADEFIDLSKNMNEIDFNFKIKFKLIDLQKNKNFISLNNTDKNRILDNFNKLNKSNNVMFFCNNCNYIEPMENGKILFSSSYNNKNININLPNEKNIILDHTLPRTKDFICPNKKCVSNSKKKINREAIFFRPNPKFYKLIYICTSCSQKWTP